MTKIDIISGFLGAGKTTLIKKLLTDCFKGEKIVLVENEFGQIGVDGAFMKESGIEVSEINSGCICCSLKGDFSKALAQVMDTYHPDRILIEPSGVGKLSDVILAAKEGLSEDGALNSFTAVCDVTKVKMYMKNFGEFYNDQVASAHTVILSRTQKVGEDKIKEATDLIKSVNPTAVIITTPWDELDGATLLSAMEKQNDMMEKLMEEAKKEHHHHHHECDDPACECHHHEHDHGHHHHECDDPACECHHHDHDHDHHHHECDDPACECHHHEHDHDHHHHECDDPACECHHHDHDHHHHHHHADDVFVSWGEETAKKYAKEDLEKALDALSHLENATVLRAKGVVAGDGCWYHFDMTPGESEIRTGSADYTGRICVIGTNLCKHTLAHLFGLED